MSELIGKEYALEVLDVFLCKQCDLERTSFAYDQSTVWGAVKMATDALAGIGKQAAEPEIIRCKDCKYRDYDDFCTGRGYPNSLVPDNGFCDKGERRE